jgi:hypothetical protein
VSRMDDEGEPRGESAYEGSRGGGFLEEV